MCFLYIEKINFAFVTRKHFKVRWFVPALTTSIINTRSTLSYILIDWLIDWLIVSALTIINSRSTLSYVLIDWLIDWLIVLCCSCRVCGPQWAGEGGRVPPLVLRGGGNHLRGDRVRDPRLENAAARHLTAKLTLHSVLLVRKLSRTWII